MCNQHCTPFHINASIPLVLLRITNHFHLVIIKLQQFIFSVYQWWHLKCDKNKTAFCNATRFQTGLNKKNIGHEKRTQCYTKSASTRIYFLLYQHSTCILLHRTSHLNKTEKILLSNLPLNKLTKFGSSVWICIFSQTCNALKLFVQL